MQWAYIFCREFISEKWATQFLSSHSLQSFEYDLDSCDVTLASEDGLVPLHSSFSTTSSHPPPSVHNQTRPDQTKTTKQNIHFPKQNGLTSVCVNVLNSCRSYFLLRFCPLLVAIFLHWSISFDAFQMKFNIIGFFIKSPSEIIKTSATSKTLQPREFRVFKWTIGSNTVWGGKFLLFLLLLLVVSLCDVLLPPEMTNCDFVPSRTCSCLRQIVTDYYNNNI